MLLKQIKTDAGSSNKYFPGSFRSRKLFQMVRKEEMGFVIFATRERLKLYFSVFRSDEQFNY